LWREGREKWDQATFFDSLSNYRAGQNTSLSFREIGERCGGSYYTTVSQAKHCMEAKPRDDKQLAAMAERIAKRLIMLEVET